MGITRKRKEQGEYICKRTPDIEFEQDWSIGLGAILADGQKIKNYFTSFRDFSGKSRQCHILRLRMYYKSYNLIKIVGAIFEKIKIFNFFSCELRLILGVGGKLKNSSRYLQEDSRYRI